MHTSYRYKVDKVYSVDIKKMREEYNNKGVKIGNVYELWHGTRVSNILSILAKGFFIPPSSASYCTGRMYGNGIYFSDQSTKSLNYSQGYWSGTREKICMMFLLDVAMGKEYTPNGRGESYPKKNYDSTFAKGGVSGVHNNEMIIYNVNQCNPKYLISFKE
jgi:poly [ADP-ribose] polymerase